ncbi:MAG: competence/damage-inducible protein A [Solirubrobacterales bacterium]
MSVRAAVLVTGTEVITGRIRDRNGPWVSEQLGSLGVEVAHVLTVADRPSEMEAALRFFVDEGIELIVTSGGLGPTADDLTAEVVGRFTGREMYLDEEMEEKIAEIISSFARRLRFDPEASRAANRKQAVAPRGAELLDPVGTAPGLVVPGDDYVVVVLPGPPRELQGMWPAALAAEPVRALLERAEDYRIATMRMFGVPESQLSMSLREIEQSTDLSPLEITTCLRGFELVVDVRHLPEETELVDALRAGLQHRHGSSLFSTDGTTTDEMVAQLLADRRIGLAESCTGGLVVARLTARPGASSYVAGGVVAYSNESKADLLDVDPALIERHGAVSPQVAEAMADGALSRFGADVALATTGVAGPTGGTEEKPVGYVCFCAKDSSGAALNRDPVLPGGRDDIRERSIVVALHMIRLLLSDEEPPV